MKNLHYWILRFYSSFPYEIISEFLAKTEHDDDDDNDDMMMMMNCLSKMTDQQKTLKNVISSWDHWSSKHCKPLTCLEQDLSTRSGFVVCFVQ